ncbi:MAG: hypothetical protein ACRCTZ_19565 [Sarcina sp.]
MEQNSFNNFDDPNNPNNLISIIAQLQNEIENLKAMSSEENKVEVLRGISKLETMMLGLQRINSSLSYLTIDETYKNFYDWRVKPSIDMITLLASAASNISNVATQHSNNVYAKKHEVKRALKVSEELLDRVEKGIEIFDSEVENWLSGNLLNGKNRIMNMRDK